MGLILDSSVLIASERRGETVKEIFRRLQAIHDRRHGLHLGFDVVTLNLKHFQLIPGLKVSPI